MLLTNTTNAVVTITQTILSNVIIELRVFAGLLGKFKSEPMGAARAKCQARHAALQQRAVAKDASHDSWRDFFRCSMRRSMLALPTSLPCCGSSGCGCHS